MQRRNCDKLERRQNQTHGEAFFFRQQNRYRAVKAEVLQVSDDLNVITCQQTVTSKEFKRKYFFFFNLLNFLQFFIYIIGADHETQFFAFPAFHLLSKILSCPAERD